MKAIKLNKDEYIYLLQSSFLPEEFRALLSNDNYNLLITEEQADQIRDLCGEQLQIVGFDEDYKLTKEGAILEALIDKFFPG